MTNDQLLDRFSSINPVSDDEAERGLGPDEWRAMFEEIISRETPQLEHRDSRRRPSRAGLWAALLSTAVVIAVALPTLWPAGPGGASPAAADALRHAADVAASQRALPAPGPNQYLYARTQERQTSMYVPGGGDENLLFTQTLTLEQWSNNDGSGRARVAPEGVTFPTAADRAAWVRAGEPDLEDPATDHLYRTGEASILDLSEVPSDPDELLAAIERREILGGDDSEWVTFQIIGELLHLCYRSPEHRAALYEVAANFPGVDYEGRVTDPTGRTGVSVSYVGGGHRQEFIFDPDTAELLAERQVLIDQGEAGVEVAQDTAPGTIIAFAGPPGTVVYWQVFLETGVVRSTDTRP
jgi:hypothetical protein